MFRRVLITGGAGFVGSSLAVGLRREVAGVEVTALDNLKRRGAELTLGRLRAAGVRFLHGDIRCPEDLAAAPDFDLLLDCAAEPSVQAGMKEGPEALLRINLEGTLRCLEEARRRGAAFLFLSTSRVYPIDRLNAVPFREESTRFVWEPPAGTPGISAAGVSEDCPLDGPRSLYGATKLAGELVLQEYARFLGLRALIDRCGVLSGPWQMARVDQGVAALWAAHHHFGKPLRTIGFGGGGKQVRDFLHVEDLLDLILLQMRDPSQWDGRIRNVGGGSENAASLRELTALCREATGREIPVTPDAATSPVDLRIFITDASRLRSETGWAPRRGLPKILDDIARWLRDHEAALAPVFGV